MVWGVCRIWGWQRARGFSSVSKAAVGDALTKREGRCQRGSCDARSAALALRPGMSHRIGDMGTPGLSRCSLSHRGHPDVAAAQRCQAHGED